MQRRIFGLLAVRKHLNIRKALFVALALVTVASLGAQQPSADLLKAADAARVAYEKSGVAAAAAVVDDGFMSSAELAAKKAEALAAGDPDLKASWQSAWAELETGSWTLGPAQVTVVVGVWDRDKKQWPLTVTSLVKSFPVVVQMVWNISAEADPKALYDTVNEQVKAKTLVARLNYSLLWQNGTIWRQVPGAMTLLGAFDGEEREVGELIVDPLLNRWDVDATNPAKVTKAGMIDLISVAGGSFKMGDADYGPIHTVTVSGFRMSRTEVTQAQYLAITGKNPSSFTDGSDALQRPVETVSWYEALAFCNQLSAKEGLSPAYTIKGTTVTLNPKATGYRLPTEAEWEYAARGGAKPDGTTYAGSNDIDTVAWWDGSNSDGTQPVATKAANGLGLYDMSGNVMEWCWDWWNDYDTAPQINPMGRAWGELRVLRGGDSNNIRSHCTVSFQDGYEPGRQFDSVGFRVVRP